ncbi:MAG: M20/M25/M40 family metallo-hydrolase [Myxococcota bacterium]
MADILPANRVVYHAPGTRLAQGGPVAIDDAVREAVDAAFEAEQVPWLTRLVEQPSYTKARDDVEATARLVDETAEDLGLVRSLHPDPSGEFADHRLYRTPATGDGDRALALVGHVDTVFPRSLGFLHLRRDEGPDGPGDVVRGPGVLDMKSGLSAVFFALRAVRAVDPERYARLRTRILINSDEEVGSPSSEGLIARVAARTTAALVFEAGRQGDRIITRRKGGAMVTLTARGRSAHAGLSHEQGASAIHALAVAVDRIEALTDYDRGVTFNVGIFEGGTAKNTVPDLARCVLDARFEHAEDGPWVLASLETIAADPFRDRDVPARLRRVEVTLSGGITRPPMEATEASRALRRRYERCAAEAGLGVGEAPLQGGTSDANLFAAAGVPAIDGLGPFGEHFHRVEEWSSLGSLRRRTAALACFLAEEAG